MEGFLQEILYEAGALVKEGDPLFRIDPLVYQAEVDAGIAGTEVAAISVHPAPEWWLIRA